ncbi:unnamed protein product [Meloidogyne enterolobii]|uniref:Uncharacterized protein n=1 Tax=Meloidogyne enterolobii TaxID=390850 RepID=A0ACB0ZC60_MELEN
MKQENLDKYDVSTDGKILSKKGGKEIQGSNAQKSLECILRTGISGKLRWGELTPPGTSVLESKLKSDNKIWPLIEKARESCTPKRTNTKQKRKIPESKEIAESKWRAPTEWK